MIRVVLRLYRNLANAFPHEFKNLYGEELVQVTEDAVEEIWRRHGVLGLARVLLDIAIRIPAEYLAEIRQDVRYGLRKLAGSPGFTAVRRLNPARMATPPTTRRAVVGSGTGSGENESKTLSTPLLSSTDSDV